MLMKILNICYDDYANYMYSQTEAMKSVGMDVMGLKLRAHAFGYDRECPVVNMREMEKHIRRADLVQIFHTCRTTSTLVKNLQPSKPITVWHTGSTYRSSPEKVAEYYRNFNVQKLFTDQCEFLPIDPSLNYVAVAVPGMDTRMEPNHGQLTVAHYPSKPEVKGTADIVRMMERFADRCVFLVDDELVPHRQQIDRMRGCDVYVELFKIELNGRPYGCFGVSAFEAAALGKIVVTNNIYKEAYEQVYGKCELVIANTEEGFSTYMADILSMTPEQVYQKKLDTFKWVTRNHSYHATGIRIKNILQNV